MSSLLGTTVAGALFGLALAAPPGPMNAIIAEESVLRGWTAGFRAGLGAMLADALFCALALAGVAAAIGENGPIQDLLYLAGGGLMLLFAAGSVREARAASSFTDGEERASVADPSTGFRKTFVLSLTNPYQIAFWLTVGVGLLRPGTLDVFEHVPLLAAPLGGTVVVATGSPALLAGFFGGILAWIVGYPGVLASARRRIDVLAPSIAALSAVVLAGFGLLFLWIGTTALV